MNPVLDFEPQSRRVAALLPGITDSQLSDPTPCAQYTVANLLDHLHGLAAAFTDAALKTPRVTAPAGDWRTGIPAQLEALTTAWRKSEAWEGISEAGGVELPASEIGLAALTELVIHGWDLAVATGQPYQPDDASLRACLAFVSAWSGDDGPEGLFGPPVVIPNDAPLLDRVLGLSGRDPRWAA